MYSIAQSTTILPSRIDVPNVPTLPSCNATGKGQLVFNTGDNKMYFCNGTAWTDMTVGGFTLPYSGNGNVTAPNILFNVSNANNGRAISGETSSSTYGTGVFGSSSNTAPSSSSPSTIGVYGINYSQNANGIGIYGQHDGAGKGIYGVVKNQGIGVHGIGLPVASGGNGNGIGVQGESTNSYGVYGVSLNSAGLLGISTYNIGVWGSSTTGQAGYFSNSSSASSTIFSFNNGGYRAATLFNNSNTNKTLLVQNSGSGGSAEFLGNVNMYNNLTVDGTLTVNNGKGVAYNSVSSTNLKIYTFTTASISAVLSGHALSAESTISFNGGFTGTPRVFVGDIDVTGGSAGELYRVQLQLYGCSTTSGTTTCKARLLNTSPNSVNYSITWNCMAIGY